MLSPLHRAWRLLPRRHRRAALFGATALLAPRLEQGCSGQGSLVAAGYLRASSGLGVGFRRHLAGMREAGLRVVTADLTGPLRQGGPGPIGEVPEGPGTLLVHVIPPLLPWALLTLGRRIVRQKRIVAIWDWELEAVPREWLTGLKFAHEGWAASRFVADALSAAGAPPMRVVPYPVLQPTPAAIGRSAFGIAEEAFVSLCVFDARSSLARKNPLAAIAAHQRAFGNRSDRVLVLKTHGTSEGGEAWSEVEQAAQASANILIIDRTMPHEDVWALIALSDVVVSLHRAEGFGMALAEALALGRPVIATGWSGSSDLMRFDGAHPVRFDLVPARDPQLTYDVPGARWAEPDIGHAASLLVAIADGHLPRQPAPVRPAIPDYAALLHRAPDPAAAHVALTATSAGA